MTAFEYALKFTLEWECGKNPDGSLKDGYVNDPDDAGGETKFGISKRAHPELDIKNLNISQACDIYYDEYWKPQAEKLPMPLAMVAFDLYVNHSYATAKMLLRDNPDWKKVIQRRKDYRGQRVFSNPTQERFLKGWLNRDNDLWKACAIWEADHGTERVGP